MKQEKEDGEQPMTMWLQDYFSKDMLKKNKDSIQGLHKFKEDCKLVVKTKTDLPIHEHILALR